ncbi:hypothetical protein RyT2_21480 [Pseudolactococcus yaeyamensis]
MSNVEWDGTAIEPIPEGNLEYFEKENLVENGIVYNQENYLIYEEEYLVKEITSFKDICDKLSLKNYASPIKYWNNKDKRFIEFLSEESENTIFLKQLSENNIENLDKKQLNISVNILNKLVKKPKIKTIQSIYILLFLSTKSKYENKKFTFTIQRGESKSKQVIDLNTILSTNLYIFYDWIVNDEEYPRAYETRLEIIRNLIIRNNNFELNEENLKQAKTNFKRIISDKTEKYFIQINKLKDDFLKLSESRNSSYRSLHLKIIGWLSAVSLFIYGEIKENHSGNLLSKIIFSHSEKSIIILTMFLMSLIFIWILFVIEMQQNKVEYQKIKKFYSDEILFDDDDFDDYIDKPQINWAYKVLFAITVTLTLLRIFIPFILILIKKFQ